MKPEKELTRADCLNEVVRICRLILDYQHTDASLLDCRKALGGGN
jgi:hypothetical protein